MASLQLKPRCVMEELIYPRCYHPKDLWKQIEIINQFIPVETNENFIKNAMEACLPDGAEALFVIPKLRSNYTRATSEALKIIEEKRRFHCHVEIERKKFCREEKTIKCLDILSRAQKDAGDIIIIPAQFGARHLGRSVNLVRKKMASNEFGLGAYEVAWMLITHNERENVINKVHMDCPGDTYSAIYSPYFDYVQKWMEFAVRESKRSVYDTGSVTGFLTNGRRV